MKHATQDRCFPGSEEEPYLDEAFLDETMAMVYVGDVYSLVVQEGVMDIAPAQPAASRDDDDTIWPYIR